MYEEIDFCDFITGFIGKEFVFCGCRSKLFFGQ